MLVSACWVSVRVFVIQTEKYHLGPWWNVHTVQCYENFDLWFFSSLKHFDISSSTPIFLPSLSSQWLPWCVSQQGVWLCAVHVSQRGVFQLLLHAVTAQSSTSLGVGHLFGKAKAELFAKPFLHSPLNLYFYSWSPPTDSTHCYYI